MPGKCFVDTNVVIYSLGTDPKAELAAALLATRPVISTQVLAETANISLRKLAMPASEALRLVTWLTAVCNVEVVSPQTVAEAFRIVERYGFSWFDSLIVAAALQADCDVLLSEDMHHSQVIDSRLHITNPWVSKR